MSLIQRITTWASSQLLKAADLNGEFNNIVNLFNNLDSASSAWTNVKGTTINATTALQKSGVSTLGIVQIATGNMGTSFNTSSTTYVAATGSSISFTPVSASSNIYLFASGLLSVTNPSLYQTYASIMNGTTPLHFVGNGLAVSSDSLMTSTTQYSGTVSMFVKQASPGLSAQTYNVGIKVSNGAATGYWNNFQVGQWFIFEIL